MKWVEVLLAKYYNGDPVTAILRPEVWAERQHKAGGSSIQGRFIRPFCNKITQSEFDFLVHKMEMKHNDMYQTALAKKAQILLQETLVL